MNIAFVCKIKFMGDECYVVFILHGQDCPCYNG